MPLLLTTEAVETLRTRDGELERLKRAAEQSQSELEANPLSVFSFLFLFYYFVLFISYLCVCLFICLFLCFFFQLYVLTSIL